MKMVWWDWLARITSSRRAQNITTLVVVVLAPVLALAMYLVLGSVDPQVTGFGFRLVFLACAVYVLVVVTLLMSAIARMVLARRTKSAGSRLHLRLTRVFALVAMVPSVTVAVFAGLTINIGFEGWFSERVRNVVGASLAAAQAYEREQREDLAEDAVVLAQFLRQAQQSPFGPSDGDLRQLLGQGQPLIQRGLTEAYVIDALGDVRARGAGSYAFNYDPPSIAQLAQADTGEVVIIKDWDNDEFRALIALTGLGQRYLQVSRTVDGEILSLLDETRESVRLYNQLENERGRRLFQFGLIYIGFAVILILGSIWAGFWFAERLSRPVGRLAGAAQRVGAGDLDVRVVEGQGDDEIETLGQIFNQMTQQLKAQRDTLLANNAQIERRRRLFDSVLSSVTSGVVGLDDAGRVTFVNRSGARVLGLVEAQIMGMSLAQAIPEFMPVFTQMRSGKQAVVQKEIKIKRDEKLETLLVRMAPRYSEGGDLEGYVVAFEDVSDLVAAQRMAAWGDVARRIAHEIKNPLTPIQLSAERISRKFSPKLPEDAETLQSMTGVIVRQTNDLRRIVDEFSKFARMPEPAKRDHDLVRLLRDAVALQQARESDVVISLNVDADEVVMRVDDTMISQALTNLIKNSGEAIETRLEKGISLPFAPRVEIALNQTQDHVVITIDDNGIGLPEDRDRLFEPYMTTRDKGTGLGLPIVKKIIEEHGGTLVLMDAPAFEPGAHRGARARISLPVLAELERQEQGVSQ